MAIVNRTAAAFSFSTTNNITIPAVTSGNSLLVVMTLPTNRAPTNVTDNGGGGPTYTADVSGQQLEGTTDRAYLYIYRRNNITTGPTQVTITTADNAFGTYNILEIDNLAAAGPTQSNIATRAFATSNTATVTTATANEIGIGVASSGGNSRDHATSESGWTEAAAPTGSVEAKTFDNPDLGAAGSKSLTTTIPTSAWIVTGLYTYAATGGGGGSSNGAAAAYYSQL
jgi:hypothetical protein